MHEIHITKQKGLVKNEFVILGLTVEGSRLENSSRHMLQASSQASWIPPSTKAAADVI